MALIVHHNGERLLADVGFGDLFAMPLSLENGGAQYDERNYFKIQPSGKDSFLLSMSENGIDFEKKYQFGTDAKIIADFREQCSFKQYSPSSYFVRNKMVTLPSDFGRKTIFNSKFIVKKKGIKTETTIDSGTAEQKILEEEFNIRLNPYTV